MAETSSTIQRCILLLEVISELEVATPQELAARLATSRSSVQRLIATLTARGFLVRRGSGYGLATYMRVISDVALRSLRSAAYNVVRELADECHETVALYVADGDQVAVIDEAVTTTEQPMRVRHPVGTRVDLGTTPGGLAYLAFARPRTRSRILEKNPELAALLEETRERGRSHGRDPRNAHVRELAVPVLDEAGDAMASLAVLAPLTRADTLEEALPLLSSAAADIGRRRRNNDEERIP